MSESAEAAEMVVRIALEGGETVVKLAGTGARETAILLASMFKDTNRQKGKTRISKLLKSGKELKVFTLPEKDLAAFAKSAKQYGILFSVARDKNGRSETVDIFAKAEDAARIQRIIERDGLAAVKDTGVTGMAVPEKKLEKNTFAGDIPLPDKKERSGMSTGEALAAEAIRKREDIPENRKNNKEQDPQLARTRTERSQSGQSLRDMTRASSSADKEEVRPSVREKLKSYDRQIKEGTLYQEQKETGSKGDTLMAYLFLPDRKSGKAIERS